MKKLHYLLVAVLAAIFTSPTFAAIDDMDHDGKCSGRIVKKVARLNDYFPNETYAFPDEVLVLIQDYLTSREKCNLAIASPKFRALLSAPYCHNLSLTEMASVTLLSNEKFMPSCVAEFIEEKSLSLIGCALKHFVSEENRTFLTENRFLTRSVLYKGEGPASVFLKLAYASTFWKGINYHNYTAFAEKKDRSPNMLQALALLALSTPEMPTGGRKLGILQATESFGIENVRKFPTVIAKYQGVLLSSVRKGETVRALADFHFREIEIIAENADFLFQEGELDYETLYILRDTVQSVTDSAVIEAFVAKRAASPFFHLE